jgi:hypothetical protein
LHVILPADLHVIWLGAQNQHSVFKTANLVKTVNLVNLAARFYGGGRSACKITCRFAGVLAGELAGRFFVESPSESFFGE